MSSPASPGGLAAKSRPPGSLAVSCLLFASLFITGEAYVVRWKNNTLSIPKYLSNFESAEGFSLAAAKDASRFMTTSTAAPSRFELYQPDFRGIKAAMQATNSEGQGALAKHHHHLHHDTLHQPSPDFERQLEQLKEVHGPVDQPPKPIVAEEEPPVAPLSRKDELFTPGLGVEEVSFLGPIRRPEETAAEGDADGEGSAKGPDDPLQPDLLESEADVLEELKKLSGLHDAVKDPLLHLPPPLPEEEEAETVRSAATERPPLRVEMARVVGIGGGTGDHFVGEIEAAEDEDDDLEDEMEEEESDEDSEDATTREPEKEVASLEERLSASLRELAELRRKQSQHSAGPGGADNISQPGRPAPGVSSPETAPGPAVGADLEAQHAVISPRLSLGGEGALDPVSESKRGGIEEGSDSTHRAAMKKAHMARKLMDPEDPKKDEDLLELMLRIAENPDEWKRVHNLLRQLDDDLTTYEKTMHRVQSLATERTSATQGEEGVDETGEPKMEVILSEAEEKQARREEMSRSGLPAGSHGEAPSTTTTTSTTSTTTQHPPPQTAGTLASGHHKEWPKFAYHRVTTAPHPDLFLEQQQHESQRDGAGVHGVAGGPAASGHHHRNAYIAVSVIAPPNSRARQSSSTGGRPLPSPPPAHAARPTQAHHAAPPTAPPAPPEPRLVDEETLREPMGEEEVVDQVARQESSMHQRMHADPVEEQLRALAAVEEKLRHHLHEKERMRHLLLKDTDDEGAKHHRTSKRSLMETSRHHHHQEGDHIALKTS